MKGIRNTTLTAACLVGLALVLAPAPAAADHVINDDCIIKGSQCVGFDCVNGESFGFDTLRLKENNLRIHFDDTSSSASFPTANWRIVINDTSNGGGSFFAVEDDSGDRSFKIENGARANALFVEDDGDIGIGTATPVADVHIKTGNTPTLRLEQDGTSGFASQTWDVAGNEANFFIRDATNGSDLPFRIFPNAGSNALNIEGGTGDIGVGVTAPEESLHVRRTNAAATAILIENANASAQNTQMSLTNNSSSWDLRNRTNGQFAITLAGSGETELNLDGSGNLVIFGELTTGGTTCGGGGCDLVFSPEYEVDSIDEHAAQMWSNRHLPAIGPTPEDQPFNLSQKTGGLIHELEKAHIYIEQLHKRLAKLEAAAAEDDKD